MVLESFFNYLTFEKRYSPHTIVAYKTDIDQLITFCRKKFEEEDPLTFSSLFIREWLVYMMDREFTAKSINRKITTLKTFYRFCIQRELLQVNPMQKVQSPKIPKRLPEFVDVDSINKLLDGAHYFSDTFEGFRDRLIINFLYSTGVRKSELIQLKIEDINFYSGSVKILGKRNKERIIPLTIELKESMEMFLEKRKSFGIDSAYFFSDPSGEKINPNLVHKIVKKYLSLVTTIHKKSPHVLRHSYATHLLNNGADLNSIKELLGHTSLAATQVYTHNSIEQLKEVYNKTHPKA